MSVPPSGRLSPAESMERGLPDDVYINPDSLPPPSPAPRDDYQDVAPIRTSHTGKKEKFKGLFKKDKGKKKGAPEGGASQLADVMGRSSHTSSVSAPDDHRDVAPVLQPKPDDLDKSSRMASFREFFKRKPEGQESGHDTSTRDPNTNATMDSMRSTMRNFFYGPPAPSPPMSPKAEDDRAPLKAPPPKSPCRMSIVMFVIFGIMVVLGITLIIIGSIGDSRAAEHCLVIGPVFLLFGCFLIIGEVFFMLFWVEDPLPCLKGCMEKVNSAIGGVEDPYGLKRPETYQTQRAAYHPGLRLSAYMPPASPSAKETIPMKTMYSGAYDLDSSEPQGPAAFSGDPPGYKGTASQDGSQNSSYYQNSSYQDDSFTAGRLL